jgi:hypothetical protein
VIVGSVTVGRLGSRSPCAGPVATTADANPAAAARASRIERRIVSEDETPERRGWIRAQPERQPRNASSRSRSASGASASAGSMPVKRIVCRICSR